ncbi:MAG: ADOP family duplicated permease [Terracidiphilus sp.]
MVKEWWSRLRFLALRRPPSETDEEMRFHLERATEEKIAGGMAADEARRQALIEFGGIERTREQCHEQRPGWWLGTVVQDARYAVRLLSKSPGFTAVSAGSLALAIGANTAIFSIAKNVLYDRLNVPNAEQLRLLRWQAGERNVVKDTWDGDFYSAPGWGTTSSVFSYPVYRELHAHNQAMQDLFAFKEDWMNATVRGNAQRVQVEMISGDYYEQLSVQPQLGRPIQETDDAVPGSGAVAVISDSLWEREFARSPEAVGQTMKLNDAVLTIVGVNPRGFGGAWSVQEPADVMVPLAMQPLIHPMTMKGERESSLDLLGDADMWWLDVMGRVKPGVQDSEARTALDVQLKAAIRGTMTVGASETLPSLVLDAGGRGLHFSSDWRYSKPVCVLLTLTGLALLLACANIANLLLARGAQRQREMSVRMALGAGQGRILRQLLTESLLLAGTGGVGGLAMGYLGRNAIPKLMTYAWDRSSVVIPFDWGVFGFAGAATILTGILFGLAPAWLAARTEVGSSLKETAHTATRRRKGLSGKTLVGFQIALSTLLVLGTGLFLRTLFALNRINVGFRTDHLLVFEVNPPGKRYPDTKSVQLHERLERALTAVPGVDTATSMSDPLLAGTMSNAPFVPEGEAYDPGKWQSADKNEVGNNFFQTMGIPIVAGRAFGPRDTASSTLVAVINQSLARERFAGVNPVGKRFRFGNVEKNDWIQIVGICGDTHFAKLRDDPPPQFFLLYAQRPGEGRMTYAVRTRLEPAALAPALRQVVQAIDPDLPMIDMRTQREQIDANMQMECTFAALTSGFGLLALALAAVGIYGVMAYSVANRTNEIGIRLALGAQPGQVRGMILQESAWLTVAGIVVGVATTLVLTRLVRSMLYGIQPSDPATLAAGALLLLGVALAASWIPARRAAGVQPVEALRHE